MHTIIILIIILDCRLISQCFNRGGRGVAIVSNCVYSLFIVVLLSSCRGEIKQFSTFQCTNRISVRSLNHVRTRVNYLSIEGIEDMTCNTKNPYYPAFKKFQ